ncbi:MAG: histidinol dehydrogenase, partial [Gammaproteobacteria bacterium]|nr:histidinol dehydrogenase [Gammaproteobacteria bacterium]
MLEVRISVWAELDNDGKKRLLARPKLKNAEDLPDQVSSIIKAVRNTGDKALRFYSQKFDAVDSNALVLSTELQQQQLAKLTAERKAAIDLAYQNIRTFHSAQLPKDIKLETSPGVQCELKYAAF